MEGVNIVRYGGVNLVRYIQLNVKIAHADKIIGPPAKSISESERCSLRMYEPNKMAWFSGKPLATTALTNSRAVFMADCGVSRRKIVLFREGLIAFERQSEKNGKLQNDNPGIFLFVIALFDNMLRR